jgi:anhydro-N-acetylmuramic acid kinase
MAMRIVGLISGTSVDGIDAAVIEVQGQGYDVAVELLAGITHPYPDVLQQAILQLCAGQPITMDALATLDDAIAHEFARAAQAVMSQVGAVDLVASHGQTVYHRPAQTAAPLHRANAPAPTNLGYSLQLGRGAVLADALGLPTVSDFRRADIEAGGQGAPLVPMVDLCLLSQPDQYRCVQNIGGIGNVAYLPPWDRKTPSFPPKVMGWDTGPGNSLIDIAVQEFSNGAQTYDCDGAWASQGTPSMDLVDQWLSHPYLTQWPPKSTGRELFGWDFFRQCQAQAQAYGLSQVDLVTSLTEFTAMSIARSYSDFLPVPPALVLVCGGGSYNPVLLERLQAHLGEIPVATTDQVGVSAAYKEAIAFALLGFWHWHGVPGNLPAVTGARSAVVLGQLHRP